VNAIPFSVERPRVQAYVLTASKLYSKNVTMGTCRMETGVLRRVNWSADTRVLHRLQREQMENKHVPPRVATEFELVQRSAMTTMLYLVIDVTLCVKLKWIRNALLGPSVVQVRVLADLNCHLKDLAILSVLHMITIGTSHSAESMMPNIKHAPGVLVNAAQRVRKSTWTTRLVPQRPTRQ